MGSLTVMLSDGPTADAQIQQILSIAPILSGQHSTQQAQPAPQAQPPLVKEAQAQAQQPTQTSGDLIDFGDGHAVSSVPPANSTTNTTYQRTPGPYEITGMEPGSELPPTMRNDAPGLQQPLMPQMQPQQPGLQPHIGGGQKMGEDLARADTQDGETPDEFVDADDGLLH